MWKNSKRNKERLISCLKAYTDPCLKQVKLVNHNMQYSHSTYLQHDPKHFGQGLQDVSKCFCTCLENAKSKYKFIESRDRIYCHDTHTQKKHASELSYIPRTFNAGTCIAGWQRRAARAFWAVLLSGPTREPVLSTSYTRNEKKKCVCVGGGFGGGGDV